MSEVAKKETMKICLLALGVSTVVAIAVVAAYHFTVANDEDEKGEKSAEN